MGNTFIAVSTILGVIASIISIGELARFWRDRDRITWRVVDSSMRKVLKAINAVDYRPDIVVGVGRGGAIVAGMLAGNLGHLPLFVVDTVLDRSKRDNEARVRYPGICPDLTGLSVLVAVGELYSGEDLRTVARYVESQQPDEVKTLTLFSHPAVSVTPDFIGRETRRPRDAPWRMSEAYRTKRL